MKKILAILLAVMLTVLSFGSLAFAEDEPVKITINGKIIESDVQPYIENDRTMVPIRVISEELGFNVEWDEKAQSVTVSSGEASLVLFIGSLTYTVNGESYETDVPPTVRSDRTFVPIRLVSETLGCEVYWLESSGTVEIVNYNVVEAKNAEELLGSINDYTRIVLTGNDYNLSQVENVSNPKVLKSEVFDGFEYIIDNVYFLDIVAASDSGESVISVEPRYANVLTFSNSSMVGLYGLTVGHTKAPGYCTGGVINLTDCSEVNINYCRLYGCGTYGITASNSSFIEAYETEIYDCTYGLVSMTDTSYVQLVYCHFHECKGFSMFDYINCHDIEVYYSDIYNTICEDGWAFANVHESNNILFSECTMRNNKFDTLYTPDSDCIFEYCDIDSAKG